MGPRAGPVLARRSGRGLAEHPAQVAGAAEPAGLRHRVQPRLAGRAQQGLGPRQPPGLHPEVGRNPERNMEHAGEMVGGQGGLGGQPLSAARADGPRCSRASAAAPPAPARRARACRGVARCPGPADGAARSRRRCWRPDVATDRSNRRPAGCGRPGPAPDPGYRCGRAMPARAARSPAARRLRAPAAAARCTGAGSARCRSCSSASGARMAGRRTCPRRHSRRCRPGTIFRRHAGRATRCDGRDGRSRRLRGRHGAIGPPPRRRPAWRRAPAAPCRRLPGCERPKIRPDRMRRDSCALCYAIVRAPARAPGQRSARSGNRAGRAWRILAGAVRFGGALSCPLS